MTHKLAMIIPLLEHSREQSACCSRERQSSWCMHSNGNQGSLPLPGACARTQYRQKPRNKMKLFRDLQMEDVPRGSNEVNIAKASALMMHGWWCKVHA